MSLRYAAKMLNFDRQCNEGFVMAKFIAFTVLAPVATWAALPFFGVALHYAGAESAAISVFHAFYFFAA